MSSYVLKVYFHNQSNQKQPSVENSGIFSAKAISVTDHSFLSFDVCDEILARIFIFSDKHFNVLQHTHEYLHICLGISGCCLRFRSEISPGMQPLEHEHLYNVKGTGYSCIKEQIYCGKNNCSSETREHLGLNINVLK